MKPNGFDHPKIWEFAQRLGIRKREAWGIVDRFWDITAKYAERGDCGKLHDALVAERVDWTGEGETPEKLIDALLGSGLIDPHPVHRFVVHDWHDHAPDYVKRKCSGQKATPTREGVEGVGWAQDDEPEPSAAISQDIETINEPGSSESSGKFQNDPEDSTPPIPSLPIHTSVGSTLSQPPGSDPPTASPTDKRAKPPPTDDPDDLADARHLAELVRARFPTTKVTEAKLRAWSAEIAKVDAEHETKRVAMDWLHSEHNQGRYAIEVRSGRTFREKWQSGQIESAYNRWRASQRSTGDEIQASALRILEEQDVEYERRVAAGLIAAK